MGWGDAKIKLARKVTARVNELEAAGRMPASVANVERAKMANLYAVGVADNAKSKTQRFKESFGKVGKVVVSAVSGLATGGVSGAVKGFVTAAQGPGISPPVEVGATPPIVNPSQEPEPRATDFGDVHVHGDGIIPLLLLLAGAILLLKKRR